MRGSSWEAAGTVPWGRGSCRSSAPRGPVLEQEPGLEIGGVQEVPNSPGNGTAAAAVSGDPRGQKTIPSSMASPGRRSHVGVPRSGSGTGGPSPPVTLLGYRPAWLPSLLFPVSRQAPGMTHFQGAGGEPVRRRVLRHGWLPAPIAGTPPFLGG